MLRVMLGHWMVMQAPPPPPAASGCRLRQRNVRPTLVFEDSHDAHVDPVPFDGLLPPLPASLVRVVGEFPILQHKPALLPGSAKDQRGLPLLC